MIRHLLLLLTAGLGALTGVGAASRGAPPTLAVEGPEGWREFWRADRAPEKWTGPLPEVAEAVHWRALGSGVERGELRVSGSGEAWRLRVIVARLDPARVRLETRMPERTDGRRAPWTVDSAPPGALLAVNAGQFTGLGPWGWVVHGGIEHRVPGVGPLAPALVVDTGGRARIVPADSIASFRGGRAVREAFQSYPVLLAGDGEIPAPLRRSGLGVDLEHRDARLALGIDREGRLLVALTRFEGLGGVLSNLPFGLTTPEMAALMGALGSRRAMLLDGGVSSQLRLGAGADARAWRGLRPVPLGLVALPR